MGRDFAEVQRMHSRYPERQLRQCKAMFIKLYASVYVTDVDIEGCPDARLIRKRRGSRGRRKKRSGELGTPSQ